MTYINENNNKNIDKSEINIKFNEDIIKFFN